MQRAEVTKVARAILSAEGEQAVLGHLNSLRLTSSELFTKALVKIVQSLGRERGMPFARRYDLTNTELAYLVRHLANEKGWSDAEVLRELEISTDPPPRPPVAEDLLISSLKEISREHPSWKPYQFRRFVESRMARHLAKPDKPFSDQDVKAGAAWYSNARKILKAERDEKDPRSRSRAHIPFDRWKELFRLRGWGDSPSFARQFQKAVRDQAGKHLNALRNGTRQTDDTLPHSQ